MPAELLFLSPTIFGDIRTYHSTPTCSLKSDFAALVRFCESFEIREILRNLSKILKSVPLFRELVTPRTEAITGRSMFGMHKGTQGIHLRLRLTAWRMR